MKKKISSDKIIFDIDYNWNLIPQTNKTDIQAVERVIEIWDNNEADKILSENAFRTYTRIRRK